MSCKPLFYTFGNHMHWVDMQWLWGYDVLPGCVADMQRLIAETGVRGCVNFDAIGYEKMASESPEALADLRAMIEAEQVEPVGGSYGQPYGLFHSGESNVRQFSYGVRTVRRLLGVRPTTFWEEEFYFFPQLPQVLRRCGYTGANLFFQWTWHTPELPREHASLIVWEGIDGSRLPALPRNALNVHQWPEDFAGLLEQGLINELEHPAIVQWLELMPSRDWMCRSELMIPRLRELMNDPRFDVRPRTCSQLITELLSLQKPASMDAGPGADIPSRAVRRYEPDDVWHGMTLGKNADRHPRTSSRVERWILAAESIAALAGLVGRPYPSWDVYPTWELDEAWRELLAAQHHDNHECEGLCGFVGYQQMARAEMAAVEVCRRTLRTLELRAARPLLYNALGWERRIYQRDAGGRYTSWQVPAFGIAPMACAAPAPDVTFERQADRIVISGSRIAVDVSISSGEVVQIRTPERAGGLLGAPIGWPSLILQGKPWGTSAAPRVEVDDENGCVRVRFDLPAADGHVGMSIALAPAGDAVDLAFTGLGLLPRPGGGLSGALRLPLETAFEIASIRTDSAFAAHAVSGGGDVCRKYPTGDWMTSPQWFDRFRGAIHTLSFIDLLDEAGGGLLVLHGGAQQWMRTRRGVEAVLLAYDPWDERRYEPEDARVLRLVPHGPLRDSQRARRSAEFALEEPITSMGHAGPVGGGAAPEDHPIPSLLAPIDIAGDPGIICHAFYRDSMKSGEHLPDWAGHAMARLSRGLCSHPYVVRLVEWDAEPGEAILRFPGAIAAAAKTNLMGEVGPHVGGGEDTAWLVPKPCTPPDWADGLDVPGGWNQVCVPMKPREIATVMLDLVLGRKQWRNLDEKRQVWATIHRTPGTEC